MNGIDFARFCTNDHSRSDYSLCINARFDTPKNPLFVVDVISELVKLEPQVSLEWIGSGYMQPEVEKRIRQLNLEKHIMLLGIVEHVENVLTRNRFFMLPSLNEGLPIALVEAQVVGLKCFISDQVPDLAQCGGCVVIPLEKSAAEWAKIMLEEMRKCPEARIDKARINRFDIDTTVKKLEKLYEELVE
jgi:glycosyltransferase involved in cell wall biosynthesis